MVAPGCWLERTSGGDVVPNSLDFRTKEPSSKALVHALACSAMCEPWLHGFEPLLSHTRAGQGRDHIRTSDEPVPRRRCMVRAEELVVETFLVGPLQMRCSVVCDTATGDTVVIDAVTNLSGSSHGTTTVKVLDPTGRALRPVRAGDRTVWPC